MMKYEFEALAGYEVSYEDYTNIIEPMYMATEMSKQDFLKCIDKKRFALKSTEKMVKEMQKIAEHLKETCTHYTDTEAVEKLDKLAEEYRYRCGCDGYWFEYGYKQSCYYPEKLIVNRKCASANVIRLA